MNNKISLSNTISSPVGPLSLTVNQSAVVGLTWGESRAPSETFNNPLLREAELQLTQYFSGKRKKFELPLEPEGTDFQKRVWKKLLEIPYGEVISYGELSESINLKGGARAVGMANGKNPICLLIPCHRVIGAKGSLTGFSGGIENKKWLLDFENQQSQKSNLFQETSQLVF